VTGYCRLSLLFLVEFVGTTRATHMLFGLRHLSLVCVGSIITLAPVPAYPLIELGFVTAAGPIDYTERCEVKLVEVAEGKFMN